MLARAPRLGSNARVSTIYDFEVESITGEAYSMAKYRGDVLLIVNTASK